MFHGRKEVSFPKMVYHGWILKPFLYVFFIFKGVEADVCNNYVDLEDVYLRSPENVYTATGPPALSDNNGFDEQWYRAGFSDMPIIQPDRNRCGTVYPFYMKSDQNYPGVNVTETKKACVGDADDECYYNKYIEVKNCGEYRVYKLKPIGLNSAAYCFEFKGTEQAPTYVPSTAQVKFQNLIWEDVDGINYPRLVFKCEFPLSDDTNLWYGVTWRVDTTKITEMFVKNSNLMAAYLNETDLTDLGYRHGISIFCDVHARFALDGRPGNAVASQPFFAGIKVHNQSMSIPESRGGQLKFEPTVPFACVGGSENCELQVQMLNPSSVGQCGQGTVVTKSEKCRTLIQGIKTYPDPSWTSSYSMEVLHSQQNDYDLTTYYTIPLTTNTVNHIFWNGTRLPDITVNIVYDNSVWRGSQCYANIDPHMKTFDGRRFEQQNPGKYVLYLNAEANQQVQYENHACRGNGAAPYCVCSVAVQAGRNVFLIDICDGNRIIDFQLCEESTLTVKSDGSLYYKITFPTGTEVLITLVYWPNRGRLHLNVAINPTAKDNGRTKGLCGVLDGNTLNDFETPDEGLVGSELTFAEKWKVSAEQDLLVPSSTAYESLLRWGTNSLVCFCPFNKDNRPDAAVTDCSYKQYSKSGYECTQTTRYSDFKCYVSTLSRKKRDTHTLNKRSANTHTGSHRQERSVPNVMSEVIARNHCESVFNASYSYSVCMDTVQEMDDSYLNNCILDLQMTGDTTLANEQLQLFNDACLNFASKNVTLQQENPVSVSVIYTTTCPSNCSNNGVCSAGVCTCESGFAGSDCSNDISLPPTVTYLFNNGLCDVSDGSCDDIFVYGDDFYRTNLTKCQFITQSVLTDNTTADMGITIKDGLQRSMFEAVCSPPTDTAANVFVTIHNISVSNDGSRYSDSLPLYIYDSTCQELQNESGVISFSLKDGFCFINGQCVTDGTQNSSDNCLICNRGETAFDWTDAIGCASSTSSSSTTPSSSLSTTSQHTIPTSSSYISSQSTVSPTSSSTTPSSIMSTTSQHTVPTSSGYISSQSTMSPTSSSTTMITDPTKYDDKKHIDPEENNQTAVYVGVVVAALVVVGIAVMMIVVVKVKCAGKPRPDAKPETMYPNTQYAENRNYGFNGQEALFSPSYAINSRPPSACTISDEYLRRKDNGGPDITNMFLAK